MLSQEQIKEILEKNQPIIKSFGVRKLALVNYNPASRTPLDFQVEFKDMSLDIYMSFKDYLEKLMGGCPVNFFQKNPAMR